MAGKIRWGILGPGTIAQKFATGLKAVSDAELTAVGSRSLERTNIFADTFTIPHRHDNYRDLANNPNVDTIYVATPHPFHKECAVLCLEAGKAVLCEKPLTVDAKQAEEMIACTREYNQFLMEAMPSEPRLQRKRASPTPKDLYIFLNSGKRLLQHSR